MIAFLLALCSVQPVVVSVSDSIDTTKVPLAVRVVAVRDLRRLGQLDPRALGVTEIGLFEERAPLVSKEPVADEIRASIAKWSAPAANSLPVQIELLSFETWPVMADGPDPVKARVRINVVSADSANPGTILTPQIESENKGFHSAADQVALLTGALRDALAMVKPNMKPVAGSPAPESPELDTAADPRRVGVRDTSRVRVHHQLWGGAITSLNMLSLQVGYSQYIGPRAGWLAEYWVNGVLRGPWDNDEFQDPWSGEIQAGETVWRRLDDGRSSWGLAGSVGGIFGRESYRRAALGSPKESWVYGGILGRAGIRFSPSVGFLSEGGFQLTARVPSVIAWFDPALYAQFGWEL